MEISRIFGTSLCGYYYGPRKRQIQRLVPSTEERIKEIAYEMPSYGYERILTILRNQGTHVNGKTIRKLLRYRNLILPASKHRGKIKTKNIFKPTAGVQLRETDLTYIPTESEMTYLMCIKE